MICAFVVAIATIGMGPATEAVRAEKIEFARVQDSLKAMKRLTQSAPRVKSGATVQEEARFAPRKAELEALMRYLEMVGEVMQIGRWSENELQNFVTVVQQTVVTAEGFDLVPEEALCWERAGLNLAKAVERVVELKVDAGIFSPKSLYLAKANTQRFRKSYKAALARCVESID